MLINKYGFRAFKEYDLSANLDKFLRDLRAEIEVDTNVSFANEEEYIKSKLEEKTLSGLEIDTEDITVTQREEMISSEYFPHSFDVDRGQEFPKPVVTFHIPYEGNEQLLKCRPSTMVMVSHEIATEGSNIIFDVINFGNDTEQVKRQRDEVVKYLTEQSGYINWDINNYNGKLESVIREAFKSAKIKFQGQSDFLNELGNKPKGT